LTKNKQPKIGVLENVSVIAGSSSSGATDLHEVKDDFDKRF
jgi:hypothetical protein